MATDDARQAAEATEFRQKLDAMCRHRRRKEEV
jgi:hypothetical protein